MVSVRACACRAALTKYKDDRAVAIEKYGTIDTWDVSVVRDFAWLFYSTPMPDGESYDLSKWDVSSAKNMRCTAATLRRPRSGSVHTLSQMARHGHPPTCERQSAS